MYLIDTRDENTLAYAYIIVPVFVVESYNLNK
jgi:hypothetical protein